MRYDPTGSARLRIHAALVVLVSICLLLALTASLAHRHGHRFDDPIDCAACLLAHSPATSAPAPAPLPADVGFSALPRPTDACRIPNTAARIPAPRAPPSSLDT